MGVLLVVYVGHVQGVGVVLLVVDGGVGGETGQVEQGGLGDQSENESRGGHEGEDALVSTLLL